MAGNEGFAEDPLAGGSFSKLLFADEDITGLETEHYFDYSSVFSAQNPPKMLCFGGNYTCSDSSSASSNNNGNIDASSKSKKKRIGSGNEWVIQSLNGGDGAPARSERNCKKNKSENSTVTGHAKVIKREKLGERIAALQQLVSPYGKTDTASVLHETMGYIRFLQEQVQVLCSPYMLPHGGRDSGSGGGGGERKDLKSRGLCLVPVEYTAQLANENGADLWSSAMVNPTSEY